jgi:hypothetical protein
MSSNSNQSILKVIKICVELSVSDKIMPSLRPKGIWSQGLVITTLRKLRWDYHYVQVPGLQGVFKDILGGIARFCLKTQSSMAMMANAYNPGYLGQRSGWSWLDGSPGK